MPTARDRDPGEIEEGTSFARGLRVLLAVADRGEVRADEIAALLDIPPSSVYRYLRTLTEFGFIDRRAGRYRLGPRLSIGSGSRVTSQRVIRLADPVLRRLAVETGETAVAVRRVGLSAVVLHEIESSDPLRIVLEPGTMTPLTAGAPGRALLAYAPPDVLEEVVAAGLTSVTPSTPDEATLRSGMAGIVASGFAISEGELVPGSVAVATPLLGPDGIVAALAVIGPAVRCDSAWRTATRWRLASAAETIVSALAEGPTA
jgi:DNA-binding IclR family transcriptional regulator